MNNNPSGNIPVVNDTLTIFLNEKDQLICNETQLTMETLHNLVVKFLGSVTIGKFICVITSRGAGYKTYMGLLNVINNRYQELWEEFSETEFGKPLHQISTEETGKIHALLPKNLIIEEP